MLEMKQLTRDGRADHEIALAHEAAVHELVARAREAEIGELEERVQGDVRSGEYAIDGSILPFEIGGATLKQRQAQPKEW